MRTGRPKVDNPRAFKVNARLTAEELAEFEAYAKKHNLTNAEVIKRGIRMLLDQEKQKK